MRKVDIFRLIPASGTSVFEIGGFALSAEAEPQRIDTAAMRSLEIAWHLSGT